MTDPQDHADIQVSAAMFEKARRYLPGGVSSPVRAFGAVGGTPRFVSHAEGSHLVDADGHRLIDFVMSWGPMILGHAHPAVIGAVTEAARKGTSFGCPHGGETELAEQVCAMYPGVERVRFTSSGTEAAMSAIRLARGVTGRDLLIKFSGCYHGHADPVLVAAGSGAITLGSPSSAGVPAAVANMTAVLPLDDEDALKAFMAEHGSKVAAILMEPVPANNGLLLQRPEYLQLMRDLATEHGAMLVFDEVISGFRVAPGGAAELYGIQPDIACFGKIIGGGLPVGAFAGPAEPFRSLAPEGPVYQAGTLSGNPVAMAAGNATLGVLRQADSYAKLESLGQRLEDAMTPVLEKNGWPVRFVRQGSLFWFAMGDGAAPRRDDVIDGSHSEAYGRFFHGCLKRGVYLAPSMYEVGFLSLAHTECEIDDACEVFEASFREAFA